MVGGNALLSRLSVGSAEVRSIEHREKREPFENSSFQRNRMKRKSKRKGKRRKKKRLQFSFKYYPCLIFNPYHRSSVRYSIIFQIQPF